jgi:hypothetical protein
MRLYSNWRWIVRKAWSIRLILFAGLLTGTEAVLSAFGADWLPVPHWVRMLIIMAVMGGAFVARIVAQKGIE